MKKPTLHEEDADLEARRAAQLERPSPVEAEPDGENAVRSQAGTCQPPKYSVAISAEAVVMLHVLGHHGRSANFIEPYSR